MPNKGNAAQLLEKYKGLARDAQMSGDRVQQEYYLQFADHYFRVLEEFNAKKDEQQQQKQTPRGEPRGKQQDDNSSADQQQAKPKRQPRKRDEEQGDQQQEKPKRTRKPKKEEQDGGEAIADALPPAIGTDEEDEAA